MSQYVRSGQRSVAEQVLARLTAIYGSQKMASMWVQTEKPEARAECLATWNEALAPYPQETLRKVLDGYLTADSPWPPTLQELTKAVRTEIATSRRLASNVATLARLPAPSDVAPADSPARAMFRTELGRFLAKHRVCA